MAAGADADAVGRDRVRARRVPQRIRVGPAGRDRGGRRGRGGKAAAASSAAEPAAAVPLEVQLLQWRDELIQGLLTKGNVPPLLVDRPANLPLNLALDDQGHTTLHWAAALARLDCVRVLLDQGADAAARAHDGTTPVMWAVRFDDHHVQSSFPDLLNMLGDEAVHACDEQGMTVLHHLVVVAHAAAADEDDKSAVAEAYMKALVGGDTVTQAFLDAQDVDGNTALHLARKQNLPRLADVLVEAGASTNLRNKHGATPAQAAERTARRANAPKRRERKRSTLLGDAARAPAPAGSESEVGHGTTRANL
ncbi:hypothetical protein AMAG_20360 [Allomyces macrogynus ATCC 38327]|uniref:Uncharacterized protein n=1 Tax=Allomyces macrogynus (strain ATCC 38327) TaxID=578462 RepID=A0A0L0T9T7_ALLM3|nr:hypothetical protein AMAG_20360 [Allomyces macrogynus ATCC 38327]|eukprot:KNE71460.1 hypothetical protein AMAG_20360 [Allomyces macrogynus ATCC 38327]